MPNYPESVEYLYSLGNEVKSLKFGLEGITLLLEALGNPHHAFESVHVAGTNGKGSTSAMIESGLRAAGLRTGLYTSPHLVDATERIRIGGDLVTREQFTQAFSRVHAAAEQLVSEGRLEYHTTYFETVTAMAFVLFADAGIDVAVLETGLGGRLDATNVVDSKLAVITPIDFDHEQWLGNTIEKIAGEKAGILKPGKPCVFAGQRPEAARVLEQRAAELGCEAVWAKDYEIADLDLSPWGSRFRTGSLEIRCPLAGAHQAENAVTAVAALERLRTPREAIERGIAETQWPGRLERVRERPDIVLDGAHNPAGARALAAYLRRFHADRRIRMIFGAMRDKSVQEVAEILFPTAADVILVAPQSARALSPEALLTAVDHPSLRSVPSFAEAIRTATEEAGPTDLILVTGSLYLVGEARSLLVQ